MNVNLWIFHHYATLPGLNGHIRPYNFARHLKLRGVDTTIFAASFQHFSGTDLIADRSKALINSDFGVPFVFVKTPASGAGVFGRVKNMVGFYHGLFGVSRRYAARHGLPDVILASSPQPLAMLAGIKIARRYGIPCICEVRDLWPEAIFRASRLKEASLIGRGLTAGEHWIYRHADAVVFTKEGDTDHLREKQWTTAQGGDLDLGKCCYINNGVDLSAYSEQREACVLDDPDLADGRFHVVYAGALRRINRVGNILDAAALLKEDSGLEFLIYGDGNEAGMLRRRVLDEGLSNVKIKGFVDRKYLPFILEHSSVNLLNYSQTEYNWTRGSSSNKLFEYMASGKPIVSTVRTGYSLLEKYQCGFELEEHTPQALASAIRHVKNMPPNEYERLCRNAKSAAMDFDYARLSEKLMTVVENAVSGKRR